MFTERPRVSLCFAPRGGGGGGVAAALSVSRWTTTAMMLTYRPTSPLDIFCAPDSDLDSRRLAEVSVRTATFAAFKPNAVMTFNAPPEEVEHLNAQHELHTARQDSCYAPLTGARSQVGPKSDLLSSPGSLRRLRPCLSL